MAIKPIIFSPPMVQALLAGRKTQTRRLVKSKHESGLFCVVKNRQGEITAINSLDWDERNCEKDILPAYGVGDVLYVRERTRQYLDDNGEDVIEYFDPNAEPIYMNDGDGFRVFKKDGSEKMITWRPSIHMPKSAARIFLEVTGVRCERIKSISDSDVIAEGIVQITKDNGRTFKYGLPDSDGYPGSGDFGWEWSEFELTPAAAFHKLIASINGPEVTEQNAWFWVYDFKVIDKPENF